MDFRKEYKQQESSVVPSEDFEQNTVVKMRAAAPKSGKKKRVPRILRYRDKKLLVSFVSGVACLLVAIMVCGMLGYVGNLSTTDMPYVAYSAEYAKVFDALKEYYSENSTGVLYYRAENSLLGGLFTQKGEADSATSGTSPNAPASSADYSDTNMQVSGVQESDIVKTDGKYIYVVSGNTVRVVSATNGALQTTFTLDFSQDEDNEKNAQYTDVSVSELYLCGNKLVVTASQYDYTRYDKNTSYYSMFTKRKTVALVYDVADPSNPLLQKQYSIDGSELSSRMVGTTLYLVSNYYPSYNNFQKDNLVTYVPFYFDGSESKLLPADSINVADPTVNGRYVIVAGIETAGETEFVSVDAILGGGSTVYASLGNLYVFGEKYKSNESGESTTTIISRFSLDNGTVSYKASGMVDGSMINQFAADECDGCLRVATTVESSEYSYIMLDTADSTRLTKYKKYSVLTVLDENLQKIGETLHFGENENIKSVRFSGEIAYVVTFRNTDPLFAIDVSDPRNPTILSALKIPGFSDYMQPFGDGLLFGFGRDADVFSGGVTGLKLSMFDVSDPTGVKVLATLVDSSTSYSVASYNHKAILVDKEKNLIGFATNAGYQLYSYDAENARFVRLAELSISQQEREQYYYYSSFGARGLYIGDYFYVLNGNYIVSYSMTDYSFVGSVTFS